MNQWNAHESLAPSYFVEGIGLKGLSLFADFLFLQLLCFLVDCFFHLSLFKFKLLDEELDSLDDELSGVLDEEEQSVPEKLSSDGVDKLPNELSLVKFSVYLVFCLLQVFLLGLIYLYVHSK